MKKKILFVLAICLLVPVMLLTGCGGMTIGKYVTLSNTALENSFSHILTDKTDLSTQKDFTVTSISAEREYDENGKYVEEKEVTQYSRKGQGADTVFVVTEEEYTTEWDELEVNYKTTYTEIVIKTYTKFVDGTTTNYYCLEENYNSNRMTWEKSIDTTYASEESFISAVYSLSKTAFNDVKDIHAEGEMLLVTMIADSEVSKSNKGAKLSVDYTSTYANTSYSEATIEKSNMHYNYEIKDNKLYQTYGNTTVYENGVKVMESTGNIKVEYSSSVTAPTSLADYQ